MARTLTRPRDPEGLGRTIAALRVYAGQRPAQTNAERAAVDTMRTQGISPDVAARMVGRIDAMRASVRTQLLGEIGEANFVAPTPIRAAGPSTAATMIHIPVRALQDLLHPRPPSPIVPPPAPPVYTLRYRGLYCQEETTWDQASWSDEVYVITSAVHIDANGHNVVRTEALPTAQSHAWYDDVDSGEVRVGPVAACWRGNSDPVSLTAVVYEHDQGDPNAYKNEVHVAVSAAIAVLIAEYPPAAALAALEPVITDAINWLLDTGDDLIESQTVVNRRDVLEWYAGQTDNIYIAHNKSTNLPYHFVTTHRGGGATYIVGFDVTREPPLPIPFVID